MKEMGSVTKRGSTRPLSIKFSGDKLAQARRLKQYTALLVDFVWMYHPEHTDLWKSFTNDIYSSSEQVQEFANQTDQLVFIVEILKKKNQEVYPEGGDQDSTCNCQGEPITPLRKSAILRE
jgi:hypothetical protein